MTLILDPDDPAGWREAPTAPLPPPPARASPTGSTPSSARPSSTAARRCSSSRAPAPARRACSRTASRASSRAARRGRARSSRSRSPTRPRPRCASASQALLGDRRERHVDLDVPLGVRAHPAPRGRGHRAHVDASRSTTPPTSARILKRIIKELDADTLGFTPRERAGEDLEAQERARRRRDVRAQRQHERPARGHVPRDLPAVHARACATRARSTSTTSSPRRSTSSARSPRSRRSTSAGSATSSSTSTRTPTTRSTRSSASSPGRCPPTASSRWSSTASTWRR